MTAKSSTAPTNRRWYVTLSPRTARTLAVLGIGGTWSYFALKFLYGDNAPPSLLLIGGILQLSALLCMVVLFFSTYSFIAHAPSRDIDERELAERYRAHFYAFQYVIVGLIVGAVAVEVADKTWAYTPSMGVVVNFISTMVWTSFVMPAALLAFWDREP